jgi:hypothetical protein
MEHQKRVKTLRRYRSIAVKPDDHILHAGTPSTTPQLRPQCHQVASVTARSRTAVIFAVWASFSSTSMSSIGSETNTGPIGRDQMDGVGQNGGSFAGGGRFGYALTNGLGTVVGSVLVNRQYWFCMDRRWFRP